MAEQKENDADDEPLLLNWWTPFTVVFSNPLISPCKGFEAVQVMSLF
jgi:hypothetical protein